MELPQGPGEEAGCGSRQGLERGEEREKKGGRGGSGGGGGGAAVFVASPAGVVRPGAAQLFVPGVERREAQGPGLRGLQVGGLGCCSGGSRVCGGGFLPLSLFIVVVFFFVVVVVVAVAVKALLAPTSTSAVVDDLDQGPAAPRPRRGDC